MFYPRIGLPFIAIILFKSCLAYRHNIERDELDVDPPSSLMADLAAGDLSGIPPESSATEHGYPPPQCNEESLHMDTPRCEQICKTKEDRAALQAKMEKSITTMNRSCQSFWITHFNSVDECIANATAARMSMVEHLCGADGSGGVCNAAGWNASSTKTRGVVFTGDRKRWGDIRESLKLLNRVGNDRPLPSTAKRSSAAPAEILVDSMDDLGDCSKYFEHVANCIAPKRPVKFLKDLQRGPYGYKPLAVLESSFDEVLFLDADVALLRDPLLLFESCEYKKTGALFMADVYGHACLETSKYSFGYYGQTAWPEHAMWALTGVEWEPKWPKAQEFESGAFLVDKTRHWKALELAFHFTESTEVQRLLYGDKDAFKFSFLALGESYALSSDRPTQFTANKPDVGYLRTGELQRMMGVYMFGHHLPKTLDVGLHRDNGGKWPSGLTIPLSKEGAFAYSYCPTAYAMYEHKNLVKNKELLACFPKSTASCNTLETVEAKGLLKDAVHALEYLLERGV